MAAWRIGNHPRQALELIDELCLYHAIFTDPTRVSPPVPDISHWSVAYRCLDELTVTESSFSIGDMLVRKNDALYVAWNLAAISPWMIVAEPPDPKRKPNAPPLVAVVSREGIKASNKLSDVIAASYRHRHEIMELKQAVCERASFINERDRFGMAIRKWEAQGGSWELQVLNALLVEAMETLGEWLKSGKSGEHFQKLYDGDLLTPNQSK